MNFNLASPFYSTAVSRPDQAAIFADGKSLSYRELHERSQRISAWLNKSTSPISKVGILASRSVEACAGILGTCWSGGAYVALNLKQPQARLISLFRNIKVDALICDHAGAKLI